jgi:lactate dehydrogenase-like 2-hydroxyacid dehydrogenase
VKHVLIVDKLLPFLHAQSVPDDIRASTWRESAEFPAGDYDGVIPVVTTAVHAPDMDRMRGLKVIANYGVGYDNVDVNAAHARGIAVSNTPGVLTEATAELTWALIFAVARRLGEGERLVRAKQWTGWTPTQLLGTDLKGRTLGIVGAGRIGRAVGTRAAAFGMNVVYWSRTRQPEWETQCGGRFEELAGLLELGDVVSIHLSRSAATERLIDAAALARMNDGAILINTARGAIVDERALIAELQAGRLRAGLDVYIEEPEVPSELLALDNVVVLPHLGSATRQARQAMWDLAWQNLVRGIAGEPLLNPILR